MKNYCMLYFMIFFVWYPKILIKYPTIVIIINIYYAWWTYFATFGIPMGTN